MADKKKVNQTDFKSNIENYYDEFKSYETFADAVRHLPGMYIGSTGNAGWKASIREIFQNATDEEIKRESPCNYVVFKFDENDQSAEITDNGRGIPHDHIIQIYTSAHMSTNFEESKKPYEYSSGTHGVGGGVAMALSEFMSIESSVLGVCHRVEFNRGIPWKYGEKKVKSDIEQGTRIYLCPDKDIIGPTNLTSDEILNTLVLKIFPLIPIGYTIEYIGTRYDGSVDHQILTNKEGIMYNLNKKVAKPLIHPIEIFEDTGTMRFHAVFTYDPTAMEDSEDIDAFANYTPCIGVNQTKFLEALCSFFTQYMNKIFLKNQKITVNASDIKTGLKAVVDADHLYPVFEGQGKVAINNQDLAKFIYDLTKKSLENWAKVNPTELARLCKYFKDIAEIRSKLENGKTKLSNQYTKSIISGDPEKYLKASGKKGLELYIVEGDSAFGSARSGRDPTHASLFPIKGKILNVFGKSRKDVFANAEIAAITKIITGLDHYDANFDPAKSRFDKIIFMADGDPDGSHITSLLCRLFVMYFPKFIEAGKVYSAVPPLFGLYQNGKVIKYFTNNNEVGKYVQEQFIKRYELRDKDTGKKLTNNDLIRLFSLNLEYTTLLENTAKTVAAHPKLLEDILIQIADDIELTVARTRHAAATKAMLSMSMVNQDTLKGMIDTNVSFSLKKLNLKALKQRLEKKYRFIKVNIDDGNIVIRGLTDNKTQDLAINPRFVGNCYEVIKLISKNERAYFSVNGEIKSLYEVMMLVDKLLPNLKRYKGLGEQNPDELYESTMDPNFRTLKQYTMQSAKEEIENIRIIDNDRSAILKGLSVTRQDIE